MARQRKGKDKVKEPAPKPIKLAHPDRSAPSEETLLQFAQKQGLFDQAQARQDQIRGVGARGGERNDDDDGDEGELSPTVERFLDAVLWGVSLTTLHFTMDVLVQRQFAMKLEWDTVAWRAGWAFLVFTFLIYALHPPPSPPILLPGLPTHLQRPLRQTLFLIGAVAAGCYLVDTTNRFSYLYVMKRAPTLGCLWLWCVVELDLGLAVGSLVATAGFMVWGGYSIMGAE